MSQIERIYRIHDMLRSARSPVPMQRFMESLEASRNTITRDFQFMRDILRAPITYNREHNGHEYDPEEPVFELPGFWMNASELHALLASEQLLEAVQPGLMTPHLAPLKNRIRELLGDDGDTAQRLSERIRIQPILARHAPESIFRNVAEATLRGLQLHVRYTSRSREQTQERTISPQRLLHYRSNWYLLGWCHETGALRLFSLDRINATCVTSSNAHECPPETLDAEFGTSFGIFTGEARQTAHLCFSPRAARWSAEELWHPDQQSQWTADGFFHLYVPYADPTELVMEVLRYGPDVEVIGPEALRRDVADQVSRMHGLYW
ncbi:helix-turn-helix transcriptional regulator [Halomonadaceae bacterium KBTZ08]